MAKVSKEIDVIDLDSDSDDESTVQNVTSTVFVNKSQLIINKEIDCIDLEESDSLVAYSDKESLLKDLPRTSTDSSEKKKIDYLNLDDSDTDSEIENNSDNNNMISLMDSASTLSDIPVGPHKPSSLESVSQSKIIDKVTASGVNIDNVSYCSQRNTPDTFQNATSCDNNEYSILDPTLKHFTVDSDVGTNSSQDVPDNSELKSNVILYREDYRVIPETESLLCRIPRQIVQTHTAHTNIISSLNWCIKKYSYLFLSSSYDGTIKIWDLFHKNFVQCLKSDAGFNVAKWSLDGGQIVAGGQEKKAFVYDVESGQKMVEYDIYNIVTSLEVHPYMEDVFLCGTRNAILGFDLRVNTSLPIRAFFSNCEEVLDIAFVDEIHFICSTNVVSKDSADRTIMVWHFGSGAKLSNQIYLERFTCPSIKVHPYDSSFIAQSNGNYIASFSTSPPYAMKNKRYVGHKVAGYGIECDISPDGKYVVSGDSEGGVYFYNYSNTNVVFVAPTEGKVPINKVKWHPAQSTTVLTSSYDGHINIWK